MRKIWTWIRDNAGPITVTVAILGGFAGIMQFSVVRPIHQRFDAQDKYINQRFDAQVKRIDDLRADMNRRFDDQNKYFNQRIDDQNRFILQGFDTVNQRFNDQDKYINQRFDAQDRRIEELAKDISELRKLSDRVSRNEIRIDALTEQLQTADAPSP